MVSKSEQVGKRPLGSPSSRWEYYITIDILKIVYQYEEGGLIRLRITTIGKPCDCGSEPLNSISHGVFFSKQSTLIFESYRKYNLSDHQT